MNPLEARLHYPLGESLPLPGKKLQVADGVYWIRQPLPFALDHINLWLVKDRLEGKDGWTVIDCGIASKVARDLWEEVLSTQLEGLPVCRVLCTHTHPDHVGNAEWLTTRFGVPLWMTLGEYAMGRIMQAGLPGSDGARVVAHFKAHGLRDPTHIQTLTQRPHYFANMVPEMPLSFRRIVDGERIVIGAQSWHVITGYGHSPEHAAFYAETDRILVAGDMLLPRISTNVGVHAMEPEANPLEEFLDSINRFDGLPEDTLVLPSHGRPFRGLRERVAQLHEHHRARLSEVRTMCANATSAADVVPMMFNRELDTHQLFFALGEALAHLHALWYAGVVARNHDADGVYRFQVI